MALTRRGRLALKAAAWVVCLTPLAILAWRALTDQLGANPISAVTLWLGDWTLRILLASLAMTPLRLLFGWSWPVSLRRLLGLWAFAYGVLHLLVWVLLDHFLNWGQMAADIVKRPYVTIGMAALLLMVPLAATSTAGMIRRLGGRAWRRLHRLVYVAAVCAVVHYLWLAKKANPEPYYYGAVLGLLLGARVVDWARGAVGRQRTPSPAR